MKNKTRIIIEVEGTLDEQELRDLPYLISDALGDFRRARAEGNPEEYVNARYPDEPGYSWLDRKAKVAEVGRRITLARRLHNGSLNPKVELPEPEPERPECEECGEHTDDDGECGECVNCGVPLCCHGDYYERVAWKYNYPCDWWGPRIAQFEARNSGRK